ncbi:prepilin-type N-terminal cleavage/methylation domain-containing protein [Aeromonas caviae]|uniref:prepilin-type N-terminal cleavage/methylation domain-containing protein n=1 Tax=Aeromonas caviae TaxID=648 RepID=UPI00191CB8FF|nr:prepilin-type N-terminal cleavage/methylation domain-containing protein [Aeromonas caviae]MBL0555976.1 prepilin-type N-terminal cleavage/methylation domain-containing protein [Aeromonas caviae]MDH0027215.1 prepilin-type N-terminal cleavage/methylation domain-containing protein [Aeromonas caviae]MDH1078990.1 prepilin-type N-terminal cleavage/methylation domain-containing protein [Aeromonas caviae]USP62691.1 prepilin-type N-terminal cleavage/methylation domain-containing protein [Aeromonas cav
MPSLDVHRGFTLIEFIVGIVLLAVALTGILGLLVNQAPQAVDPVQQVRAAQLAQRILSEVLEKSFDEHSDHNGGRFRCGETAGTPAVAYPACTDSASYGPDSGETRPYQFNDVDDFDTAGNWVDANQFTQTDAEGVSDQEYRHYQVRIAVTPDTLFGSPGLGAESIGKRVALTVRLPDQSELAFTLYRGNY